MIIPKGAARLSFWATLRRRLAKRFRLRWTIFIAETEDRLAVNLLVGALTFRPARFSRKLERSPCEN